ncbi:MAG: nucleoside triphosphate pyrophosphohydrolase [Actinomycetota bacterium]|nr:nucleoside triphosphate pyrophosphohydrolase [Actinomycetota bacterium]
MSDPQLLIVGLGPAGLDRLPARTLTLLEAPERAVIVRTTHHPASEELAERREVVMCDDLYETATGFDEVYDSIADRVLAAVELGPVAYAVPGSAVVGERAVADIRRRAARAGITVELVPGESFLDLIYAAADVDPIVRSVKILDGRELPDPLVFDAALIVTQVDRPEVLADVAAEFGRVLQDDTTVMVLDRLGDTDEVILETNLADLWSYVPGPRTSLFLDPEPAGWYGLVVTNRLLRQECPWDRKQTHHTLLSHLIEEAYETVDSIRALPADAPGGEPDYGAYAEVEEELGDLLLQVVFHATLASEVGAFDVEEVAEITRRKLVRRHPHVFGEVVADDAATVISNWEAIKGDEKSRESLMDDIPTALPAISRADKMQRRAKSVGFDWDEPAPVFDKVREELAELVADADDPGRATIELGDVMFAVVNLARHLGVDPEQALATASDKFSNRFRAMEQEASAVGRKLAEHTPDELEALWEQAKRDES